VPLGSGVVQTPNFNAEDNAHTLYTNHLQVTTAFHPLFTDIYYSCACAVSNKNNFIDYARFRQILTTDNARFSTQLHYQIFEITHT
jgi:hypothetical protein